MARKLAVLESKGKGKRRFVVAELVGSTAGGGPIYMRVTPQVGYLTHEVAIAELERERAKDAGRNPRKRRIVRRVVRRSRSRARRNPAGLRAAGVIGSRDLSESSMWRQVKQIAGILQASETAKGRGLGTELRIIANAALDQLKRGVHENPTLAIVGAANPPGRLLGEIVGDVKYHRTTGKYPGYYKHGFKGRSKACIYAMPDGTLRIIGKGR